MLSWVKTMFAKIENKSLDNQSMDRFYPFQAQREKGVHFQMKPLKPDFHRLVFVWPMLDTEWKIKQCHLEFLLYLFNHDGKHSLQANLRNRKYAWQVLADVQEEIRDIPQFRLQILLTEEGLKTANKVQNLVFAYVQLIREKGVNKELYALF